MGKSKLQLLAAGCAAVSWSASAAAQGMADRPHGHAHAAPGQGNYGELSFPNSGKKIAQAPFLRGVKLLHNFQYDDAIPAFQQAQKADPDFVLAYWGEAMAHNYTLWSEQHTDEARKVLARLGATPEARAAKAKTAREKMWLAAVEALYGPGSKFERDEAYADRMDALHAAYPDDVEARVFDALATMGRSHGTRDTANYMKAAAMLEEVFPTHMHHPGVVHYLIHAYDDPAHAPLGIRAARLYDKIAPDSAHAQHMTSHIFLAMGMWPEAEEANVRANAVSAKMMAEHHMTDDGTCGHPDIWLVYARWQQGKDPSQEVDGCRAGALKIIGQNKDLPVVGYPEGSTASWADMAVRTGIETGKSPKEWLPLPPGKLTYARFLEDYGRLLSSRHDGAGAEAALKAMKADREILATNFKKEFPDDNQTMPWIDRAVGQAEAVVALANRRTDDGIALLRKAAVAEAALPPPFGPPALQKPSYELLGDELLALGRKTEAADAYRQALAAAPGRRLSLAGLKAASATDALASTDAPH
jgi:tetratricopeptide (TPR) repeat protein